MNSELTSREAPSIVTANAEVSGPGDSTRSSLNSNFSSEAPPNTSCPTRVGATVSDVDGVALTLASAPPPTPFSARTSNVYWVSLVRFLTV